jgi:hypothetical protein
MGKLIDWRFILTPFATTQWTVKGIERKRYYIFGFKIADIAI